jgi:hypothetical protein
VSPLEFLEPSSRRTPGVGSLSTSESHWIMGLIVAGAVVWDIQRKKSWTRGL